MNLMDLFIKIGVDDQATSKISKITSSVGNGLKTAAQVGTAAIGVAAAGITALTTASIKQYAEYEQLVGGVETLFKESADAVKGYADEAYKSAGLSANEYMSTVTSFAASLLQSTGRGAQTNLEQLEADLKAEIEATKAAHKQQQTELSNRLDIEIAEYKAAADAKIATIDKANKAEIAEAKAQKNVMVAQLKAQKKEELEALKASQKLQIEQMELALDEQLALAEAANMRSEQTAESQQRATELANMAVIDMADNANKMGTAMELIQNAYQGFAKQNYTMLKGYLAA